MWSGRYGNGSRTLGNVLIVGLVLAASGATVHSPEAGASQETQWGPDERAWPTSWYNPSTGSPGGSSTINANFGAYDRGCTNADTSQYFTYYLDSGFSAHLGLDMSLGDAGDVYAIADGEVIYSGAKWGAEWGGVLMVESITSDGRTFAVTYGHVDSKLSVGETVDGGGPIATLSDLATGDHLHLGLKPGSGTAEMPSIPDARVAGSMCGMAGNAVGMVDPIRWLATQSPCDHVESRFCVPPQETPPARQLDGVADALSELGRWVEVAFGRLAVEDLRGLRSGL